MTTLTLARQNLPAGPQPEPAAADPQPEPAAPLAELVGAELQVPLVTGASARYANLDYAASAPALRSVADQVATVLPLYSSVHRGAGYASAVSTAAYEAARRDVATFVGARTDDVVIVTRNTTDALNLLASAVPGPVVHLDIEHHANLLPWQARKGRVVVARDSLDTTVDAIEVELAREPSALLAVTGASMPASNCSPAKKGAHPTGRRTRAAAARTAVGPGRQGIPLRHRRPLTHAGGTLPWPQPAAHLPLHVRPELCGLLPDLLLDRRQHQRRPPAPERTRCDHAGRLAGPARDVAGVQAADGLEIPLGVVGQQ